MIRMLFWLMIAAGVLAAAIFYLLSELGIEHNLLEQFNLGWAVFIACGSIAVAMLLRGVFGTQISSVQKLNIFFGAIFAVAAALGLISALSMPNNIILPIVAVAGAGALFLMIVAGTWGKAWDEGDNQKSGYRNYHQRKSDRDSQDR